LGADPVPVSGGAWRAVTHLGDATDVAYGGKPLVARLGGLRVAELKEVCGFADACLFLDKGVWQGESYAAWEARPDDGEYYIAQVGQVTHVGQAFTWTAHVTWLPPAFMDPAHMTLRLELAPGAFEVVRGAGGDAPLTAPAGADASFTMGETEFIEGARAVLKGPAGAFELRTVGLESEVRITQPDGACVLHFRENESYLDYMTNRGREFLECRRGIIKWIPDIHVHRITISLRPVETAASAPGTPVADHWGRVFERAPQPEASQAAPGPARALELPFKPDYGALRGARFRNLADKTWDLGWFVSHGKDLKTRGQGLGLSQEFKRLEGVWQQDFGGEAYEGADVETSRGSRTIRAAELLPARDAGLPMPRLGVLGDVQVAHRRNLSCPVRYFDDAGRTVQEDFLHAKPARNSRTYSDWPVGPPSLEKRRTDVGRPSKDHGFGDYSIRNSFLNSTELDSNGDGKWLPTRGLMRILSYRLAMHLDWALVLPATWFEAPAPAGAELRFTYLAGAGPKQVRFALHPELLGDGRVKLAVMGRPRGRTHAAAFYIVQSAAGRGRVIAKIADSAHPDHVAIVAGSIEVGPGGVWQPEDRVPQDKRPWFGPEGTYTWRDGEENFWEMGRIQDYPHPALNQFGGLYGYWGYSTYRDPYIDFTAPLRLRPKLGWLAAARRYGVLSGLFVYQRAWINPASCPREFAAERLDPETGAFHKYGFDFTNPEAVAWRREQCRKLFLPFKGRGTVPFVQCSEVGNRLAVGYEHPYWSEAALASFRKWVKDPDAKFPTDPSVAETARTANRVAEERWQAYFKWHRWVKTNENLAMYEGARDALGADPYYRGGVLFCAAGLGVALKRGVDLERVAASPAVAMLVCEYPGSWDGDYEPAKPWHDAARAHAKRFIVLHHDQRASTREACVTDQDVIRVFKKWGVDIDTDGLIMCGYPLAPGPRRRLWEALAAKYYGKGRMSVAEADAVIRQYEGKPQDEKAGAARKLKDRRPAAPAGMAQDARRVEIPKVRGIRVDGDLSDWEGVDRHPIDRFLAKKDLEQARAAGWQGIEDLSGSFVIGYDEEALFLGVSIRDDVLLTRDQITSRFAEGGGTGGDEVEWFLCVPDPRVAAGAPAKTCQFALIPGRDLLTVDFAERRPVADTACASRISAEGYAMEARLPWAVLGCTPAAGARVAFDVYVLDRDRSEGGLERVFSIFSSGRAKPWRTTAHWAAGVLE